jgi:hypothetical protein
MRIERVWSDLVVIDFVHGLRGQVSAAVERNDPTAWNAPREGLTETFPAWRFPLGVRSA